MANIPPPERAGAAVRTVRRRWARRAALAAAWAFAGVFAFVVAVPAFAFAWGAVDARLQVERGRGRVYGFGRPDLSGPILDTRSGLRWRSLGCCVDPYSSAWCAGFNRVMRHAAERGEVATRKHLLLEPRDAAERFAEGYVSLPAEGRLDVTKDIAIAVGEYDSALRLGGRRERRLSGIHPSRGEVDVTLEADEALLLVRITSVGGCPSNGPPTTYVRYLTFDTTTGECLQEIRP